VSQSRPAASPADEPFPGHIVLRFEEIGEGVTGLFCGQPLSLPIHRLGDTISPCIGVRCPVCEQGSAIDQQIFGNLFVPDEWRMRVLTGDRTWLEQLERLAHRCDLQETLFAIEFLGWARPHVPRLELTPVGPADPAQLEAFGRTPLYDLQELVRRGESATPINVPEVYPAPRASADLVRDDLKGSLRFVHYMGMQTRVMALESRIMLLALVEQLVGKGVLDLAAYEERRQLVGLREAKKYQEQLSVHLGDAVDKYTLADLPVVDCESRLPICLGRCCYLTFPLGAQDLDERIVEWAYERPYMNRRCDDGLCVHADRRTHRCEVYQHRPVICRTYSCAQDKRIWDDFERRIPAPLEKVAK